MEAPSGWTRTAAALLVALAPVAGPSLAAGARGAPPPRPRNLLLVSIDTLRPDMLGSYGYERPTSPALDALAAEGAVFETALSPAPWTLPAHASLLTGLYPMRHGVRRETLRLPDRVATLAALLRQRGFATAAFVNSGFLGPHFGLLRGFDSAEYVRESEKSRAPSAVHQKARAWLADPPEPFFLFLHFYDVHSDYASLERFEKLFARPYEGPADGTTAQLLRFRRGELPLGDADRERLLDLYAAGIRQMDRGLAFVLEPAARSGLLDRSLLVVTSDHGEEFLEHGGVLHGRTQYDELLRVPLVVRGPGVAAGTRVREPVSLVDVAPTALSVLGAGVPPDLDGIDLAPLLRGERPESAPARPLFGEADHNRDEGNDVMRSIRTGGFKLVWNRHAGETRLYDLANDPGETRDVKAEHPALADRLRRKLEAFERSKRPAEPLPGLPAAEIERLRALGYVSDGSTP